ncbi:5'-3' exoribonuclease 2 [Entophlyctis luteolus]|nr:5'-3' exoribonuclease 2 [Entophlyctis luteolus]
MSQKYPKVTSQCVEDPAPADLLAPNPNGVEFDCLYLDMNGIIHPCCHPDDGPAPPSEDAMMLAIFAYIDRILAIVRPRRLLFMAIDGVAPRAKMNQQRSRRFRASQEAQAKFDDEEKLRIEWEAKHGPVAVEGGKAEAFDSNCITPGTPFMANLATALRYYISDRLNKEPAWKDLKVILSDASVPGEGEHKIMDFIRRERTQKDYNPNTSHVLYGLDADLIMLGLATHEPHFKILREDVFFGQTGRGKKKEIVGEFDEKEKVVQKPYVFLHVSVLREYLAAEMFVHNTPFAWDLERAIDDWVFLCFFVGNDFLPHIPSLEIREGAIDTLIEIWKRNIATTFGGYITNMGEIDLGRAQILLEELGRQEQAVFVRRRAEEERRRNDRLRRKAEREAREGANARAVHGVNAAGFESARRGKKQWDAEIGDMARVESFAVGKPPPTPTVVSAAERNVANKAAAEALKKSVIQPEPFSFGIKRKADAALIDTPVPEKKIATSVEDDEEEEVLEEGDATLAEEADAGDDIGVVDVAAPILKKPAVVEDDDVEPEDNIRLWESGWKKRYYEKKFHVDEGDKGCQSWKWFYPYHYSPFSSDFDFISTLSIDFELGEPFKPIEQLMGVFPAASRQHIPDIFHPLMTDEKSPIIDFYPVDFPLDMNGKKYAWQGVALLPFIDEQRLLAAMRPLYAGLTEEEIRRNTRGSDVLYVREGNRLYEDVCILYGNSTSTNPVPINPKHSAQILGFMSRDPDVTIPGMTMYNPLESLSELLPDISDTRAISCIFHMPKAPSSGRYPCTLLRGMKPPPAALTHDDIVWVKLGGGVGSSGRGRGRGRGGGFGHRGGMGRSGAEDGSLPYMGGGGYSGATSSYSNNYGQSTRSNSNGHQSADFGNDHDRAYNNQSNSRSIGNRSNWNERNDSGSNGSNLYENRSNVSGGNRYGNNTWTSNSGGFTPKSTYGTEPAIPRVAAASSFSHGVPARPPNPPPARPPGLPPPGIAGYPAPSYGGASLYGGAPGASFANNALANPWQQQQQQGPPQHGLPQRPATANLAWSRNVAGGVGRGTRANTRGGTSGGASR